MVFWVIGQPLNPDASAVARGPFETMEEAETVGDFLFTKRVIYKYKILQTMPGTETRIVYEARGYLPSNGQYDDEDEEESARNKRRKIR